MKKIKRYLWALAVLAITVGCTWLARQYGAVLDTFYPYVTRQLQAVLAYFSSGVSFTVWQAAAVVLGVGLLVSIVVMILRKWNFFRWLGWVLCMVSFVWMCHTCLYGLNFYASPLSEHIRQGSYPFTEQHLEQATIFFRDQANALAETLPRDGEGNLLFDDFDVLAEKAGAGYENLKMEGQSVFAGSTLPVKKLSWAKLYSSMGICGVTMAVTGEAAVNPNIPNMSLPFVMCHEMAHRMCIALEDDANFAGFLACEANPDVQFQYSAFYMAYRYCMNELGGSARAKIREGENALLRRDLTVYDRFFAKEQNKVATGVANAANNVYIQASGDSAGTASYGQVATHLVNWYIENEILGKMEQQGQFDPLDEDFINGILGGKTK